MSSKENVRHAIKNEKVQNKNSDGKIPGSSKFYTVKETIFERKVKRPCKNERYKYAKDDLKDMNSEDSESKIPVSHYSSNNSNQPKKIEVYEYITSNSSKKYSQIQDKRTYTENNERFQNSNPSTKSRYIIETKKVETFKPKCSFSKINDEEKNISDYRLKELMKEMWIKKSRFSSVQSLCCLGYSNKSSQKDLLFEEYEEEIRKMKNILIEKEKEIKKVTDILNQNKRIMNLKNKKIYNLNIKKEKKYDSFDVDAHELQIISTKLNWNEITQPSPVNEIFIESFKYEYPSSIQYTTDFEIIGKDINNDNYNNNYEKMEKWSKEIIKKEEEFIDKDTISDRENILEMQEMASMSIISKKLKYDNICQNLGSMIILSNSKDEKSDFSDNIKDEKPISSPSLESIQVEKEPLIFQKIEEINISSNLPKNKNKNKIQELDGLQIINYSKINDKLKKEKKKLLPQFLNELVIPREYDMHLVKPLWNSLMIQSSGLNIIAITKDIFLENQEVDEFEIIAQPKKEVISDKIQVLIPIPDNNIQKLDNFQIIEFNNIKRYTEEEVKKILEKRINEERIGMNKEIQKLQKELNKKDFNIKEIYPEKIDNLNISMDYSTKEYKEQFSDLRIGKEKISLKISNAYQKKENKDKFINLKVGREKISLKIPQSYSKIQLKTKFTNLKTEKNKLNIKNSYPKIERKNIFENLKIENEKLNIKNEFQKIKRNAFKNLRVENEIINIKNSYPKIETKAFKNLKIENVKLNIKNSYPKFEKRNVFKNLKVEKKLIYIKNSYPKYEKKNIFKNLKIEKEKLNIKNSYPKYEKKNIFENLKIEKENLNIKSSYQKEEKKIFENLKIENEGLNVKRAYPKIKSDYKFKNLRLKKESICLLGKKKIIDEGIKEKRKEWNEIIIPIMTSNFFLKKENLNKYSKKGKEIEKIKKINWNDKIRPIKTTKLIVKGIKEKELILKIEKNDKFRINSNTKKKKKDSEFDIEKFALNLSFSDFGKKLKESLKIEKVGLDIKGLIKEKEEKYLVKTENILLKGRKKEIILNKSKIETVNIKGLDKKNKKLKRCITENINIKGKIKKKISLKKNKIEQINIKGKIKKKEIIPNKSNNFNIISKKKKWNELNTVMRTRDLNIFNFNNKKDLEENEEIRKMRKEKIVEETKDLKGNKDIILKEIKENKLFIKGIKKENNKVVNWNEINKLKREGILKIISSNKKKNWNDLNILQKEYTLKIINKDANKIKLEKIDWNDMNKIIKKDSISLKIIKKSILYKKDKIVSFNLLGINTLLKNIINYKKEEKKIEENLNNWYNNLKAQRNSKFSFYGKGKKTKLMIIKGDKLMIQKEIEDEIIYNNDYNFLNGREKLEERKKNEKVGERNSERKKINNKELDKIKFIKEKEILKEKEIIPRMQREIIAQIGRVKEEESEDCSSQSEIDVLAGIRNRRIMMFSGDGQLKNSNYGYQKKEISGEVIFTPKSELGVNLGGAQYKNQRSNNAEYYYKIKNKNISGMEIRNKNNGKIIYEIASKGDRVINQGDYEIIKGNKSTSGYRQISTTYANKTYRQEREPKDSKSKKKNKIIDDSQTNKQSEYNNSRRVIIDNYESTNNKNNKSSNYILKSGNIQQSSTNYEIKKQGNTKVISMKKEEYYNRGNKSNIEYKKMK